MGTGEQTMSRKIKNSILSVTAGAMLALFAPNAMAVERVLEEKEIAKMAREADSPAEHTEVAKQYVWRAEALEAKADKIERELRDEKQGFNQMAHKWPAMVQNQRERKERVAMQARRAATEAMRLAEHHSKLAGKALDEIASLRSE